MHNVKSTAYGNDEESGKIILKLTKRIQSVYPGKSKLSKYQRNML